MTALDRGCRCFSINDIFRIESDNNGNQSASRDAVIDLIWIETARRHSGLVTNNKSERIDGDYDRQELNTPV